MELVPDDFGPDWVEEITEAAGWVERATGDLWRDDLVDPMTGRRALRDFGPVQLATKPHEIELAMAFPAGYIPAGLTKKARVSLAGNAVTPPVMAWICGRILQALEAAA